MFARVHLRPALRSDAAVTGARFAAVGAALATAWESVGDAGQFIIMLAALFAAFGFLYSKVAKPGIQALWRTWKAVDALENLPQVIEDVRDIKDELAELRRSRGR